MKDGFDFIENRFFVRGEGNILYNFNGGRLAKDPKTAAQMFLRTFETISPLLEKYQNDTEKFQRTFPSFRKSSKKRGKRKTSSNSSNPILPPSTARSNSPSNPSNRTKKTESTKKKTGTKANPRKTLPTLPHPWQCSKRSPPHWQHHRQQRYPATSLTSTSRPTIFPPLRKRSPRT